MALVTPLARMLDTLIKTGTRGASVEQANRVIVVNTLSIVSALLAGSMAYFIFLQSGDYSILIAGLGETMFFSCFLLINYAGHHGWAAAGYVLVHNIALFYFAVLRGMVVEERMLAVFLFVCSLLIFGCLWQITISLCSSAAILVFGHWNQQHQLIESAPLSEAAGGPFHELGTIALLTLILVAIGLFKKQDLKLIRKLRASNQNLDRQVKARTAELETANANVRFFFDQLSHDIRDKLHALQEMNALLRFDIGSRQYGSLGFYAGRQQVAIASLLEMASDILTLKMIESGQYHAPVMETIELKTWLQQLVGTCQYNADRQGVSIHLFADKSLPEYIVTDPVKLDKIISNLLGNAVRHTEAMVVLTAFADDHQLRIEIKDKGKGISPELLPGIFDKNYTSDTARGTGLGLYIVKWLSDMLEIRLSVDSEIGKGTTFHLAMPLVTGSEEDCYRQPETPAAVNLEGKRILIADDARDNRLVLEKNLLVSGCEVLHAENGADLLRIASREEVDLIILDNQMPVMSGMEALRQIRADERMKDTRVILMTAASPEPEVLAADADDYLFKPVNMRHLLRSVSQLLGRQLSER